MKSLIQIACATLLPVLIAARDAPSTQFDSGTTTRSTAMKPSVTYLYLLRRTPFFTRLSSTQLRSVIEHSHEWETQAGTVVAECASGTGGVPGSQDVWILLDGGWQVEYAGHVYPAGHASAGKWFSPDLTRQPCRLVTNEHSYVMKIERAEFDAMLAQGFAFGAHLDAGRRYYRELFDAAVPAVSASAVSASAAAALAR